MTDTDTDTLPRVIGRESHLMEQVAKTALDALKFRHNYTEPTPTRRGYEFTLEVCVNDKPTGHVARVSVELLHFTPPDSPGARS